jgi:hypothetical protein
MIFTVSLRWLAGAARAERRALPPSTPYSEALNIQGPTGSFVLRSSPVCHRIVTLSTKTCNMIRPAYLAIEV